MALQRCGHAQGAGATRWRRPGADEILLVYLLLATIGFIWDLLLSPSAGKESTLATFLVTAFLAWRVSRGGRISRMILILISGRSYAVAALSVARLWDFTFLALVIIGAAQVALLFSPPVYGRTRRPGPIHVRAQSWAQLLPPRPPAWLPPWGDSVLITATALASSAGSFIVLSPLVRPGPCLAGTVVDFLG